MIELSNNDISCLLVERHFLEYLSAILMCGDMLHEDNKVLSILWTPMSTSSLDIDTLVQNMGLAETLTPYPSSIAIYRLPSGPVWNGQFAQQLFFMRLHQEDGHSGNLQTCL